MCEWNFREAEARRARIAQKSGLQHEHRVGGADAIECCVERRNEERIPKCRAFLRTLAIAHEPRLERFARIGFPQKSRRERASDAQFAGNAEVRVARKGPNQMQGRREGGGTKPPRFAAAREDRCVETRLQVKLVPHSDCLREIDKLRAARQEDVLAVVDFHAVDLEGGGPTAQDAASLEKFDVRSGRRERKARGETREAASDDRYALDSQERTTTMSFSVLESAARARSGSPGSRSIFLSSSS